MSHFTSNEFSSGDNFVHQYQGITSDKLGQEVDAKFLADGYKIKSGGPGDGVYVKGNRTARLLLGAFYKYFEFYVKSEGEGENAKLTIKKTTSGMSGGLIGVNQVKNELRRLEGTFKSI